MSPAGTTARRGGVRRLGWQAALVLLPVLVLAAAGMWALRQDRRMAERDLAERAQILADDAAQRVLAGFFPFENGNPCITNDGVYAPRVSDKPGPMPTNMIFFVLSVVKRTPHLFAPVPASLPIEALTAAQSLLWQRWVAGEVASTKQEEAWLWEFLGSKPPPAFAAVAEYEVANALFAQGQSNAAFAGWERALALAHGVNTEAGLPLERLVQLRLLEHWPMENLEQVRQAYREKRAREYEARMSPEQRREHAKYGMKAIDCANSGFLHPWLLDAIHNEPSPVTGWMVAMADQRGLALHQRNEPAFTHRMLWDFERRKLALAETTLAACSSDEVQMPYLFHVHTDEDFLVVRNLLSTGTTNARCVYFGLPKAAQELVVQQALGKLKSSPPYLGFSVEIAGRVVGPIMSSAPLAISKDITAVPQLRVMAKVVDFPAYHAVIRRRTFWFDVVVVAATLAVLVGFYTAWRAFQRQQRLAEMKGNFVSSVSHELRAPVASIRLMVESLETGRINEPEKVQEYHQFISQECQRLSSLIENVLDFARIDQGRKQYQFGPTDPAALVKAAMQLLEPVAQEKGICLRAELDEAALAAVKPSWDGRAIQQALINLLDNAIKYSGHNTSVTIRAVQNGASLCLRVEDQGMGIPPEEQQRIFERFYRVGSELRRETQGVGIGLSIVKHIVEAHGGRVEVRSAAGQGACFTMALPMEGEGKV